MPIWEVYFYSNFKKKNSTAGECVTLQATYNSTKENFTGNI